MPVGAFVPSRIHLDYPEWTAPTGGDSGKVWAWNGSGYAPVSLAFDPTGTAAAAVAAHVAAANPHTQYLLASGVSAYGATLIDDADAATARTTLGLGTAAVLNVGTSANNIVQLTAAAKLPAVDGSLLTGLSGTIIDTRANLLASSPASPTSAFASDTLEPMLWNGSAWYVAPLELITQANAVDMGLQPPMVANDRAGYTADYITDKALYNVRVLGNANTTDGNVRTSNGVFQFYANGAWNDVVTGFRFREDSAGYYELEHKPVGFTWWLEVMSGNSDDLGLNGLPLAQQYRVSMGAYPVHEQIVGRSITA